jgi:hypothetical protein
MGPDYPSRIQIMRRVLAHREAHHGDVVHGRRITFWYGLPQVEQGERRPPLTCTATIFHQQLSPFG